MNQKCESFLLLMQIPNRKAPALFFFSRCELILISSFGSYDFLIIKYPDTKNADTLNQSHRFFWCNNERNIKHLKRLRAHTQAMETLFSREFLISYNFTRATSN